jgi:dihydropyrimidinase
MPAKGLVEVGRDADLVVWDPAARRRIRQVDLHHSSDYTPFEGLGLRGTPRHVFLRGVELGTDERGPTGRFIERTFVA